MVILPLAGGAARLVVSDASQKRCGPTLVRSVAKRLSQRVTAGAGGLRVEAEFDDRLGAAGALRDVDGHLAFATILRQPQREHHDTLSACLDPVALAHRLPPQINPE